jgi:ABC-type Fe3+-hydroxamate transport system substrate-binding protein
VAATIGALALALTACSSSSAPATTTTTTSATPTTDFVAKANAICRTINQKVGSVQPPSSSGPPTVADLPGYATYFRKTIPYAQQGTAQLLALTPPAAIKQHVATLLKSDQDQIVDAENALRAASGGDRTGFIAAVQKLQTDSSPGNAAATAAGLTDCAGSSG